MSELVAHAGYSDDIFRILRVALYVLAQSAYEYVKILFFFRVFRPPDFIQSYAHRPSPCPQSRLGGQPRREAMVEADNKRINESRASLLQRKADLEDKIARASQAADNMASIEKFCELVRRNIDNLTDEDKKLAAQALDVKVHVYPDRINIEGIIPILDNIPSDYVTSRLEE